MMDDACTDDMYADSACGGQEAGGALGGASGGGSGGRVRVRVVVMASGRQRGSAVHGSVTGA